MAPMDDTSHEFCKHRLIALGRPTVHIHIPYIHTQVHTYTYSMPTACSDYVEESNYLAAQARPGDMTLPMALLVTACTKTQAQLVQQDVNALHR
jgi:hypothetical protein